MLSHNIYWVVGQIIRRNLCFLFNYGTKILHKGVKLSRHHQTKINVTHLQLSSTIYMEIWWSVIQNYFFIGVYSFNHSIVKMFKVTIGNLNPDWALNTQWAGTCSIGCSTSILSSSGANIYTFHVYGNPNTLLMFTTFSKSDGSIVGSRYVSNIVISNAYWAKENGDYLSVNVQAVSNSYLVLYNINYKQHINIIFKYYIFKLKKSIIFFFSLKNSEYLKNTILD